MVSYRGRCLAYSAATLVTLGLAGAPSALGAAAADKRPAIENTPIGPANPGSNAATSDGMGSTILRMGVGLLVVVGLVLGLWYLMKRVRRAAMPGTGPGMKGLVDVVATTPLGPTRFLHLVRVGGELILVGATDHTITAVARLAADEAAEILNEHDGVDDLQAAFDAGVFVSGDGATPPLRDAQPLVERLRSMTARR